MKEIDVENILAKYPDLIESGLRLVGRQVTVYGRRMDLLFEDVNKRKLIVELKSGPILDKHIGQIMAYEGGVLSDKDPDIRIMLIGTRVPPNLRKALDHHGFAWKEINFATLKSYLNEKSDTTFGHLFQEENLLNQFNEIKSPSGIDLIDTSEFPLLVEQIIEKVLKPISSSISAKIGKRYTSYFLQGRRFLHFYDRSQTRIQLHIDKSYLEYSNLTFDIVYLATKLPVHEATSEYVIKINSEKNLDFLADFLFKLYKGQ
jgi:hypothetical protein